MKIIAIAAMDEARVIGVDNRLPWKIPEDMQRFARLTANATVLMGRKTYESLPPRFRPLPGRLNYVVSRTGNVAPADLMTVFASPEEAIAAWRSGPRSSLPLWVIGGEQIYRSTLPLWDEANMTLVDGRHEGDAFFPEFESGFVLASSEEHEGFRFEEYRRA